MKTKLLLHICCGPCSLSVLDWLKKQDFDVTGFFFNPNIQPLAEYMRRRESTKEACESKKTPLIMADALPFEEQSWCWETSLNEEADKIKLTGSDKSLDKIPPALHPVPWFRLMHQRELDRCELCWNIRIKKSAEYAKAQGFDAISTTLLYSKYQNHEILKASSGAYAKALDLDFVYYDFREFWQDGIDQSRQMGIYRQAYCGCIFSEYARYAKQIQKLTS